MNNIKNNLIKVLLCIFIVTSFSACDEGGDPDPGSTTTGQWAGDWYMTLRDSDGNAIPGVDDNVLHQTYNTAANDNSMWLVDYELGYYVKCKFYIDENGNFSATDSQNLDDGGANDTFVTITDGHITKGGGISKGGHVVDKITFRAHYSYDADGYDILYEGTKRTGFFEDEY
ncbi:MAG TPA: lipid-binding protein [Flavobacterium sp.]|nr:lipid-binding protein [Flavobacterium sp.]